MQLFRFGPFQKEKPGIIIENKYYDISPFIEDYNEVFFQNDGLKKLSSIIKTKKESLQEIPANIRIGSVVARPSKIICIGLNYIDHAKETGADIPKEPILFFKSTTSLCGPNDNIIIPKNANKLDWEVELAMIVGTKATYVEEQNAHKYIAGYCLHNDYSERAFQLEHNGQWAKGKGCDTFAPLGPILVTADEIENPNNLKMWLSVNGKMMQNSSTANFIFNPHYILSYLSQFMTLLPGDIISTGTPSGVGLGIKPNPIYLKENDIVKLGIEKLGTAKQCIVKYSK